MTLSYKDFSAQLQNKIFIEGKVVKAQIELTYACNLHCHHCYTDPYNNRENLQRQLSTDQVCELLDKLKTEGILWVCFTGGEIFMRKDFSVIYQHAWRSGFLITLFTNATLVTNGIVDLLKSMPPFAIEISWYGASQDTYESMTQVKGSFQRFWAGVHQLKEAGLPLKMKASITQINFHELVGMRQMSRDLGYELSASGVLHPKLNGDLQGLAYRLTPDQMAILEYGESAQSDPIVDSCNTSTETNPRLYRCLCGKVQAHVDPEGQVGPCTWSRHGRFGYREKTMDQGIADWADNYRAQEYDLGTKCRSCTLFHFCDKLPEISSYETGDVQLPVDHHCKTAEIRRQNVQNGFIQTSPGAE